jgi:hypothetical protein
VTVGDLLSWAMQDRALWRWTCTQVFHASGHVCDDVPGVKPLTAGDWAWDGALQIAGTGAMALSGLAMLATCPETAGETCAAAGGAEAVVNGVTTALEEDGGEPEAAAMAFEDLVASDSDTALNIICGGAPGNSFDPDTPVLLADGESKPIGEIRVGDLVQAGDPTTNAVFDEPVTKLHHDLDQHFADLIVSAGGHDAVLRTTANHVFWDASARAWTTAAAIKPGDRLDTMGNEPVRVVRVHTYPSLRTMDNLTVDRLHTYYVLAGGRPVLVHNECDDHIALGLSQHVKSFSEQVGGRNLMADMDWKNQVVRAAYDGNTKISVTLDGVEGRDGVLMRGKYAEAGVSNAEVDGRQPSPFDWEMYMLDEGKAWSRVTFYEGGKVVDNPFVK